MRQLRMDGPLSPALPPVQPPPVGSNAFETWITSLLAECRIAVEQSRSLRRLYRVTFEQAPGAYRWGARAPHVLQPRQTFSGERRLSTRLD